MIDPIVETPCVRILPISIVGILTSSSTALNMLNIPQWSTFKEKVGSESMDIVCDETGADGEPRC
jgi:hypothetical protein